MASENVKSIAAFNNIIGGMRNEFYKGIPHEFAPGHNLHKAPSIISWNPNHVASSIKTFPYNSSIPTPMKQPTKLKNDNSHVIQDPAISLILRKENWQKKVNKMKSMYKKEYRHIKNPKFTKKNVVVSQFLIDFAEIFSEDPDAQFNGTYDWYYTGGNLRVTELAKQKLLFQPSGLNCDYLSVVPLHVSKDRLQAVIENLNKTVVKNKHPIFEIISETYNQNSQTMFVGVRQKHCFTIYEIAEAENLIYTAEPVSKVKTKKTLTSASLDKYSEGKFCTLNTDKCISIYDINSTESSKYTIAVKETNNIVSNKWCSVNYVDANNLIYADRCCVQIFDTRMRGSENVTKVYSPKDIVDICDEISITNSSKFANNYIYIGTNHSLFLVDARMLNSSNITPVQRWTHMLKSTPCMLDTLIIDETELIHISSPLVGDNRLIVNGFSKSKIDISESKLVDFDLCITDSVCLPWQPPSILDSLQITRNSRQCLGNISQLKERLNLCTTGSVLLKNENNVTLLTQNSVGDIFQQKIVPNCGSIMDNSYVVKDLHRWNEELISVTDPYPLEVTSIVDMKPIARVMKSNKFNLEHMDLNLEKQRRVEKWQKPISKLFEYRDVLAMDLLEPWGFTETSINEDLIPSQLRRTTTSNLDKVSAWLENAPPDPIEMSEHVESQQSEPIVLSCPEPSYLNQPTESHFSSQPIFNNKLNMSKKSERNLRKRIRLTDGF